MSRETQNNLGIFGLFRDKPRENLRMLFGGEAVAIHRAMNQITERNNFRADITGTMLHVSKLYADTAADVTNIMRGFASLTDALHRHGLIGPQAQTIQFRNSGIIRTYIPVQAADAAHRPQGIYTELDTMIDVIRLAPVARNWTFANLHSSPFQIDGLLEDGYMHLGTLQSSQLITEQIIGGREFSMALAAVGMHDVTANPLSLQLRNSPIEITRQIGNVKIYGRA